MFIRLQRTCLLHTVCIFRWACFSLAAHHSLSTLRDLEYHIYSNARDRQIIIKIHIKKK